MMESDPNSDVKKVISVFVAYKLMIQSNPVNIILHKVTLHIQSRKFSFVASFH